MARPQDVNDLVAFVPLNLFDLKINLPELVQIGRKIGELLQSKPAGMQVRLDPLDTKGGYEIVIQFFSNGMNFNEWMVWATKQADRLDERPFSIIDEDGPRPREI